MRENLKVHCVELFFYVFDFLFFEAALFRLKSKSDVQ